MAEKQSRKSKNDDAETVKAAEEQMKKLCEASEHEGTIGKAYAALDKMYELLGCGDNRIELSAAKEILSLLGIPDDVIEESKVNGLEVEIKII